MKTYLSYTDVPLMLTVDEAAMLLRISRNSAYAAVRNGDIPSARYGKQIRIYRDDVLKRAAGEME